MLAPQKGWLVSVSVYSDKAILNVSRLYENHGGKKSIWVNGDAHGKTFRTSDEAWEFAKSRGYTRTIFKKGK